ncbi:MAG: hypothetical protein WDM81_19205 [Rhizomicrobium sp.]
MIEADVVAGGRQRGRIGRQGDGSDGGAILLVADRQLRRDMLRVTCATAVAEQEDLSAAPNAVHPGLQHGRVARAQGVPRAFQHIGVLVELREKESRGVHARHLPAQDKNR